jgi:hypothetical protein
MPKTLCDGAGNKKSGELSHAIDRLLSTNQGFNELLLRRFIAIVRTERESIATSPDRSNSDRRGSRLSTRT